MVFFFVIVFIAELIIACQLISWILAFDKKVCEVSDKVCEFSPKIQKGFTEVRIAIYNFQLNFNKTKIKILEKKEQLKNHVLKNIIISVIFWALKTSGKKYITTLDTIISLIKLIKNLSKK